MTINYPEEVNLEGPIIFLAGPIQCAPPWQEQAAKIIHNINNEVIVASPRMTDDEIELRLGKLDKIKKIDWETKYLKRACQNGVILFWLAKRVKDIPSQAYAKSSRFELAEWKEKYFVSKFNLVIGIEDGFDGDWYIQHRLNQDCPDLKIFSNLNEACKFTTELISKKL